MAQETLDLTPHEQDVIASKIKDGEVCQLDLKECKSAVESQQEISPGGYLVGGAIGGAVLTFLLISLGQGR